MNDDRTPILIGAGQYTQRDVDPAEAKEPLEMMAECARRAAEDAGADAGLLAKLDAVAVVSIVAWHYQNPPRSLAERLGAQPAEALYTTMGGNTPQWLVNETAQKIATGRTRVALLAGAEAVATVRRAHRQRVTLKWTTSGAGEPTVIGDARPGTNAHEVAHALQVPIYIFPLFENALRAHRGQSIAQQREMLGTLCSRMSSVAADNPYAWFRIPRSASEITTVTPQNRMIGFPYPKYMNAIIDVDQAAAVLMTSVGEARTLGIDPSRWVYLWGCGDAHDLWYVSERVNYHGSPAIRVAGEKALAMAGIGIDQIDLLDLYSCFPCAVQLNRDMLGVAESDRRPLTVTGGLPYHGGPGSNYSMHAVATMMNRLRAARGQKGLVSALGWYATKHSIGIYATEPNPKPWVREDPQAYQAALDAMPHPALVTEPRGRGTIETYTVMHDRDGQPVKGIVIGRLADGRRFLANTPEDRQILESLMVNEAVGRAGTVAPGEGANRFDPE